MSDREHLIAFLVDAYSIEQQALVQMRTAPEIAGGTSLSEHFREHLIETQSHAELVKDRLEALGGSPSKLKDAVMRLGGKGFLLFARTQADTPGKLAAHAHSYEALEFAAYDLLVRMAQRAGDEETERVATIVREQEAAMRDRLAGDFDEAVEASLSTIGKSAAESLDTYLADAHALEAQSLQLLEKAPDIAGDPQLRRIYEDHRKETAEHARLVEERLESLGGSASAMKDAALRVGALNWSLFFRSLDDTSAKLAAFVYAVEHLEAGGYELLRRVAERAGDAETVGVADRILEEEHAMARRVLEAFGVAFEASMGARTA